MTRLFPIFLGLLLLVCNGTKAWAASAKATALRQANGLTAYNLIQLMQQMYQYWYTWQGAFVGDPTFQRF